MKTRCGAMLSVLFFVACGPTLLLPGGALEGAPASPPADWGWTEEVSTIQLETNPPDPYSVNIWVIGIEDRLYVHAGANRSMWVEYMEIDPSVRVLINGKLYRLEATRVADQEKFDAFATAYELKYGSRPRNENVDEAYLFLLQAG